jgi:hypothetical protein
MKQIWYEKIRYNGALLYLISCLVPLGAQGNEYRESTYEQVQILAQQLAAINAEKISQHLTISDFYQHLPQVREATGADAPLLLRDDDLFLRDWYALNTRYQKIYDEFIIHKQGIVIEQVNKTMEHLYYSMDKEQQKTHRELFAKMQEEFHLWQDYKTMVGDFALRESQRLASSDHAASPQQLQQKRKYAYDAYFTLAHAFHRNKPKGMLHKIAAVPVRAGKTLGLALSSPFVFFGYWAARPFYETPLYSLGMKMTREMGKGSERFKELSVEGSEFLEGIKDTPKNTVNLILPNHRNDTGDVFMLASLKIAPAMLFLNGQIVARTVERSIEQPLGNVLASLPEFVSVGACKGISGLNPADKMLKTLRKGHIPNVINYAQGFVANMHEILGISPAFVPKLLGPLLAEGYKVRIYPVSYEIESSFLWSPQLAVKKAPMVRVVAPLAPAVVAGIYKLQMAEGSAVPNLFETFIRSHWIDSIRTFPELTLAEIQNRVRVTLGLKDFNVVPEGARADF